MTRDKIWIKAMSTMSPTCHQRVDRSYNLGNYQLPVCARCQGVYLGYLLGIFIFIPVLTVLIPLTYLDGFIQLRTNYQSTNFRRLTTGILSGIGTIQLIKLIIIYIKTIV